MKKLFYLAIVWLVASSFTTIHLMGDSTMAEKDLTGGNPERGWGMMLPNFVDDSFRVVNYAQNGRSTKSFIDRGLWDKVYDALRPGDYVFIQFGHNDAKADDPERYAPAFGAYQDNLRQFVRGAREKGATPVLLTPVARRWFKDGKPDIQPVDETTPEFRDFHFSDITCAGADQAIFVNGLPEMPVRNLAVVNSTFTSKKGAETYFSENVTFENVIVNGEKL